tara:strand:- start:2296 stop:2700 length:405 start_codon:yes stop_codon:yes gene_type:complete
MIINPNNTTHTISVIPRFYVDTVTQEIQDFVDRVSADSGIVEDDGCIKSSIQEDFLSVIVTDSFKNESTSLENAFEIENGMLVVTFDYTFTDESSYNIAINYVNTSEVIYRGLILATVQDTQDYSLTQSEYNWK